MAILTLRLVSVMMQKRVIALAVPAVVLTAMKGGMALADLSTLRNRGYARRWWR
jgi:hypothetical protein